jgi:hypothetical protein
MSIRVLSSDQARTSAGRFLSVVNGGLLDQIGQLKSEGDVLSNPEVWDGNLARQFRESIWPEARTSLDRTLESLRELQRRVAAITSEILSAGGN